MCFHILAEKYSNKSKLVWSGLNSHPFADLTKQIAKYDVLCKQLPFVVRSCDADGTVRHAVVNDLPLGRNIDEMLRMVDTMLFTNEHGGGLSCRMNKGDEGMANLKAWLNILAK